MTPTASQNKHKKALNAFNKVYSKVVKLCNDLDTALIDTNTGVYRLRRLTSRLYADANSMETKGKIVEGFDEQDFSKDFNEDKFDDEFEEASREAESLIKCGNDEIGKRDAVIQIATPSPTADQAYKYEKLQVEPFNGDHTIWPYWREQAKEVIKGMSILKQRMWLIAKIQGDAREFIGITNLHTLTIDKIFARLSANYGQPHMRAKTIAIANNDMVLLGENSTMKEIEKFWNKSMNVADQCAELKITAESLTITHAMQHLPPKFRERLEVKMREVKADYIFTRADAVTPFSLVKAEMLSSYPDTISVHSYAACPVTPASPNAMLSSGAGGSTADRGSGRFNPNRTDGDRGRGSSGYSYGYSYYTPRGQQLNRYQKCIYCNGDHINKECHHYDTPQQKRERLVALKKCRACMRDEEEHGKLCAPRARCSDHPGEKHFWHICDGPSVKHPGTQFTQSGPQNSTGRPAFLKNCKGPNNQLRDAHIFLENFVSPEIIEPVEPKEISIYQTDIQEESKTIGRWEDCSKRHMLEDKWLSMPEAKSKNFPKNTLFKKQLYMLDQNHKWNNYIYSRRQFQGKA